MKIENFLDCIGGDFYTGVPDSQLKPLCDYLAQTYGMGGKHIIAANEGNAVGLAAGHYLATGQIPVVYMQNSGLGNVLNPVASLTSDEVYGIPCIFVVGWRGEPGVPDEPQHIFQGKVTIKLLEDMEIHNFVVDKTTTVRELQDIVQKFRMDLEKGRSVAFVIKKGALSYEKKAYQNVYTLKREDVLQCVTEFSGEDVLISTTGKASRELFEIREQRGQDHSRDFLTVGSMGHSSSIALKIALEKPEKRIWCIDGDGALLMHMGSMAVIGSYSPQNLIHLLINNQAHETVGGMPTVAGSVDFQMLAKSCGYARIECAESLEDLEEILTTVRGDRRLTFLEVKCAIGSRENLGRPTTTPQENRDAFMKFLYGKNEVKM